MRLSYLSILHSIEFLKSKTTRYNPNAFDKTKINVWFGISINLIGTPRECFKNKY